MGGGLNQMLKMWWGTKSDIKRETKSDIKSVCVGGGAKSDAMVGDKIRC